MLSLLITLTIVTLVSAAAATSERKPRSHLVALGTAAVYPPKPDRPSCRGSNRAIDYYRQAYRDTLGRIGPVSLPPRRWWGCNSARRRAVEWREKAHAARETVERLLTERLTIPSTSNWVRAMRYAQRPFPGTLDWLEAISGRECRACWTTPGGFICNYQGSGACGPMQFMSGTFYGHADDARAWLEAHGYIVAESTWDWHDPLGQALTAAYMRFTGQDGCHWCL